MNFETNLLLKRKQYRERRNSVRKFFFFVLSFFFVAMLYVLLQIPSRSFPKVEIYKTNLVKSDYVLQLVNKELSGKNFFLISPRAITKNLLLACPLLSDVFIRKYLYPEYKIIVVVKENSLWGKIVQGNNSNSGIFITNNGKQVQSSSINSNLLPVDLILLSSNNKNTFTESTLLILKDVLDYFNKTLQIKVEKFFVTDSNTLEIYIDNSIKIDAGYIDIKILEKIQKLNDILTQIKKKSYLIKYIDLSLENGAVIRKNDEEDVKRKHLNLFMLLH